MAWIKRFEQRPGAGRIQPSQVVRILKIFELSDSAPITQIDTRGSAERAIPGKQRQTFNWVATRHESYLTFSSGATDSNESQRPCELASSPTIYDLK
jgi:hypothetical protein